MRLIFKLNGMEPDGELFEQQFASHNDALDYLEDMQADDPNSLLQTEGLALWGIVPDDYPNNLSQEEANRIEKVANYASLLIQGRATPASKVLHRQLIKRGISLTEHEFEQGNITPEQLGVDGCERFLSRNPGAGARSQAARQWLDEVRPGHSQRGGKQ